MLDNCVKIRTSEVSFVRLIEPSCCLHWLKLYQLYKKAFPIYERKPFAMIYQTFRNKQGDVWYIEDNGYFVGLAFTLNDRDIVLLDYFAIDKPLRNQGYGSQVMQLLQKKYQHQRLFVEIESTLDNVDNLNERLKRKQFYLNNGMKDLHILANVYGTPMELLGFNESVTFEDYYLTYYNIYGKARADRLILLDYPEVVL